MSKRFEIRECNEEWGDYNELWDDEEVIASDHGEPEDQTFYRDWSWVCPLLNELNDEIVRLKDKIDANPC